MTNNYDYIIVGAGTSPLTSLPAGEGNALLE
jgi:hypothetical protein